ncbi:multidrug effflux MFS transporter [Xylophilus sp. GW821-FHT01B05]
MLIVLSALLASASVATDIYLPALPLLSTAFHADPAHIQWTISGFLLGFSLGQLLWGPIGDRFGRRRPVVIGLLLFIVGSGGCALSGAAWQLTGWRVVQAVGACAGPVLARAMVHDVHGREHSARVLSTLMLVMGIAPLVGPILGGQILVVASWRAIFWVVAGFGALALVGVLSLPETMPPSQRSSQRIADAIRGYMQLVRNPRIVGYALSGGLFYGGIFAYIAGTPFAYIDYYHVPPQAYGLLFGINIIGLSAANLLNARMVQRLGANRLLRAGTGMAALSGAALGLDTRFGWMGLVGLAVPLLLYTSSLGFIVANSVAGALAVFPTRAGAASALVGAMQYGTGVLGSAMVGWFADGTPATMGWIVGAAGVGSFLISVLLVKIPASGLQGEGHAPAT